VTRDLWYHELGCSAWVEVTRNTVTHDILSARLVTDRANASASGETPARTSSKRASAPKAAKPRAPRKPKDSAP
jgi:sarcosine oxidase subunit delta